MSSIEAEEPAGPVASPATIERIYLAHRAWLRAFLNRRFGNSVGADLVQEAFARTLASGSVMQSPRAFLKTVAIRAALEEIRRRPEVGIVVEPISVAVAPDAEVSVLMEQLLLALPEPIRDVFVLSRFGGLSNVEIARRCNLSVKHVEARLTEARRRCAALMQD